jgi:DNA-directed RNA polymerase specialized sigma24 family protein
MQFRFAASSSEKDKRVWNQRMAQLSKEDREKVIQFHHDGMTATAIAKRFGVSTATISRALTEKQKPTKPGGIGRRIGWGEV